MKFHIVSLFPGSIEPYFKSSIIGRAVRDGKLSVRFYNPRDYSKDKFHHIDQRPYSGGPGMVIEPLPVLKAVEAARGKKRRVRILFFSPAGRTFDSAYARELAAFGGEVILIAGHYEGIDARVQEILKAEEVSVGPYVLTGGELPAALVIDATARYLPGVLGNIDSLEEARIASPEVYTRPETLIYKRRRYRVPEVLRSGHHKLIEAWKRAASEKRRKSK